jgi:hypothetical protein
MLYVYVYIYAHDNCHLYEVACPSLGGLNVLMLLPHEHVYE